MSNEEKIARQHPYFIQFEEWAKANACWTESYEDWGPWFEAFAAGCQAVIELTTKFRK